MTITHPQSRGRAELIWHAGFSLAGSAWIVHSHLCWEATLGRLNLAEKLPHHLNEPIKSMRWGRDGRNTHLPGTLRARDDSVGAQLQLLQAHPCRVLRPARPLGSLICSLLWPAARQHLPMKKPRVCVGVCVTLTWGEEAKYC